MLGKKKVLDILQAKQAQLDSYTAQFDTAVALVNTTIGNLDQLNRGIEETIKEIEDYQNELEATITGLSNAKTKNDKVIANFKALLCAD